MDLWQQLESLKAAIPNQELWPPELGSFMWCMWTKLEQPEEKMGIMDMCRKVAEKVWAGEAEAVANDCEVPIC
ncbi:MAG TPA: hypothetical protein PK792_04720 [Methanothrix soehngenii]|jgi:anthranilate phosphoribosyltransferase|uniref:hypothetical protein n=1 Tax=Methanothrix soehngenii TaxID=2223 RepID=UPI002B9D5C18|nr:hypothetical protein [Methanothrix soehngenii]HOI20251.1 hypothetical protein [Methanothrix soehngenii]